MDKITFKLPKGARSHKYACISKNYEIVKYP